MILARIAAVLLALAPLQAKAAYTQFLWGMDSTIPTAAPVCIMSNIGTCLAKLGSINQTTNTWTISPSVSGADYDAAIDFGVVPNTVGAAASNCAALTTALATIDTNSGHAGGTLRMPGPNVYTTCTLDNKYNGITVTGRGSATWQITPTVAVTVLKHRTPYGAYAQYSGGGFVNFTAIGNGLAGPLLEIDSISGGTYVGALSEAVAGAAALNMKVCVSNVDLVGKCDVQSIKNINLTITQNVNAVTGMFVGFSTNANVSGNLNGSIIVNYKNALAYDLQGYDNNQLALSSFRASLGTATRALTCKGGIAATGQGCYANTFHRYGAGYADTTNAAAPITYAESIGENGTTANVQNTMLEQDVANATPDPTVQSAGGSRWTTLKSDGRLTVGCALTFSQFYVSDGCKQAMEFEPNLSANNTRMLFINRNGNVYINNNMDAANHNWYINGILVGKLQPYGGAALGGELWFVGQSAAGSTATPSAVVYDGTFSSSAGSNGKINLLGVSAGYDIGVSAAVEEFMVPTGSVFTWYVNHVSVGSLSATGMTLPGKMTANQYLYTGSAPTGSTGTCTVGTFTGGTLGGTFVTPVCALASTIILSGLPASTTGYNCSAVDRTTQTSLILESATTSTSVTFKVSGVATVNADVVQFSCPIAY